MKISYTLDMTPEEYKLGIGFLRFALTKLAGAVSAPPSVWPLPAPSDADLSALLATGETEVDPDKFDILSDPPSDPPADRPTDRVEIRLKLNGEEETLWVTEATLDKGCRAFDKLAGDWAIGFGSGMEEPDRGPLMEAHAQSPEAGAVLAYLAWKGGLTRAIQSYGGGLSTKTMRDMAIHIAQVASLMHPDLADQLEARNPLKGA